MNDYRKGVIGGIIGTLVALVMLVLSMPEPHDYANQVDACQRLTGGWRDMYDREHGRFNEYTSMVSNYFDGHISLEYAVSVEQDILARNKDDYEEMEDWQDEFLDPCFNVKGSD